MPSAIAPDDFQSISTTANVHIVHDPTILEYDTVNLSFELFIRLFPNSAKSLSDSISDLQDHYVLLKFLGVPDYFRTFKVYKVSNIDHKAPTSNSVIFKNSSNLLKFGNHLTFNTCVIQSIDYSTIPHLNHIFVSLPNHIYDIFQNLLVDSIRQKFIDNYLQNYGSVVSNGDIIRLINAEVKLCEPVPQGVVDDQTNIVLVKDIDEEEEQEDDGVVDEGEPEEEEVSSYIDLSSYLTSSMKIDLNENKSESQKFNVRPLPSKISFDKLPPVWTSEDSELFVFINTKDIPKINFPLFNGDSVLLKYNENDKIIVKLFTLLEPNRTFPSGVIYISSLLLINLNLGPTSQVSIEQLVNKKSINNRLTELIPIAKSATISRIASPITMDRTYQQSFLSALKNCFHSSLKCVKKDDLVPVVIDSVLAKTLFDVSSSAANDESLKDNGEESSIVPVGDPDSVAWFKIIEVSGDESIETDQFIIDPLKTGLISSGLEFVRQPENNFNRWYEYLNLPPIFNYNKLISANSSVFKYAFELKKILTTCLSTLSKNPNLKLKTSILLNSMSRGLGKTTTIRNLSLELGLNLVELDCFELINRGAELKTVGLLSGKIDKILNGNPKELTKNTSYHIIYLKHIENLCVQTNQNEQGANLSTSLSLKIIQLLNDYLNQYPNLIVVMSCNDIDKLNNSVRLMIKFQIDFGVPNEDERLEIFRFLINKEINLINYEEIPEPFEDKIEFNDSFDISKIPFNKRRDISFKSLALQSAGLTPRDLISIVNKSKQLAIQRLIELSSELNISIKKLVKIGDGGIITWIPEDFNKAINEARNQFSDSIGAPRIPNVKWEDIGGLDLVKDEILDTIDMPLKHPELFNNGLKKRSGILFYGPPGTGKTLLAKAIATNFSLNFFSVKGPELLNMYIGESEANVRRVFQKARDAKPCVIFFDELDSVAPKRGNQGDSGGVMDRIVSQLLAELDGMSGGGGSGSENTGDGVFVVGATNRPDLLDEALLRPGRFDKMLYLGISDTNDKQAKILEALTRKFKLDDDVDLNKIAEGCSFTFTGADFYALCSDSMLNAMTRCANEVDSKIKKFNENLKAQGKPEVNTRWWFDNEATPEDIEVLVKMEDFLKSQSELTPSVSAEELEHYLRVRENFEGGKEKAQQPPQQEIPPEFRQKIEELIAQGGEIVDENGSAVNGNGHIENGFGQNGH